MTLNHADDETDPTKVTSTATVEPTVSVTEESSEIPHSTSSSSLLHRRTNATNPSNNNNTASISRKANIRGDGSGGGGDQTHAKKHHTASAAFQSLNYHPDESEVWRAHVAAQNVNSKEPWWQPFNQLEFKRWVIAFLVGLIQALIAFTCGFFVRNLTKFKFDVVYQLLQEEANSVVPTNTYMKFFSVFTGKPFLAYLFFNLLYTFIAAMCVVIEPASAGGGISEIKCYLNGVNVPGYLMLKTLICKVVGVTFSVSAAFPVGKEGPMFHSGAIVAALVAQAKFWCIDFSSFSELRNDQEKRDFVTCGAAAGVASAFASPIGGVLLSLEEGASFWSTKVTWRAFFCAMIALGTMLTISSLGIKFEHANIEQLFSFGEYDRQTGGKSFFAIWELIMFMIVGCLGGLLGAIFNESTEHIVAWRMKYINKKKKLRLVEALLLATAFSIVFFSIPLMWNQCTEKPQDIQDWSEQEKNLVERLVAFKCKEGQYNEVASLIFTDADNAMKQLLHFRDDGTSFSSAALFLFFVPYFIFVTLAYGSGVPAGLFVPSLLAGAGFGRMCGHLLHKLSPGTFADAGTYALMGAAAILGGMSRMTISITVILLEVTGDMEFVLPLMLTLMCARFSGNVFGESCYDILIHLKHIPFLEADVPSIVDKHDMVAGQVMNTDVKCLQPVERVGVVYDLLKSCSHRVFPVVDMASNGTLYGTVSRDVLCTLMQRRAFGKTYQPDRVLGSKRLSPLVSWDTIEQAYPDYPTINDVLMRHIDRERTLDLRPYANTAPYTINETASIQRTYRLFRTLGLRCLCVVNHNNKVVGVITRKDLLPDALSRALLRGRLAHYTEADDHHTEAPGDANIMEPPIDMKRVKALMKKQDYEITEYDDDYSDDHVDDGRTVL